MHGFARVIHSTKVVFFNSETTSQIDGSVKISFGNAFRVGLAFPFGLFWLKSKFWTLKYCVSGRMDAEALEHNFVEMKSTIFINWQTTNYTTP